MDSDGKLTQDQLRNSAIRTYSRIIPKMIEGTETSEFNVSRSKDLLTRLKKNHPTPFSHLIDVVRAVGEEASQEYAPPDMHEREAVAHANTLWHKKPREVRDHIIGEFATRIGQEEKTLPEKGNLIPILIDGQERLVKQRIEENRLSENRPRASEPAKQPSLSERFPRTASFLRKFGRN